MIPFPLGIHKNLYLYVIIFGVKEKINIIFDKSSNFITLRLPFRKTPKYFETFRSFTRNKQKKVRVLAQNWTLRMYFFLLSSARDF